MTRFRTSTESAREVAADLLIVPAFTDGELGPGLKDVGLADAYAAARLSGKKGEDLLVTRRDGDRFAAGAVLVVGAGPKADFDLTTMRRTLGRAAASTRRFPTVATTFARAFGARQAADAVQAAVEAIDLGRYRFDRYKSSSDETALKECTVLVPAALGREGREGRRAGGRGRRRSRCGGRAIWSTRPPATSRRPRSLARRRRWPRRSVSPARSGARTSSRRAGSAASSGVGKGSVNPPRMIELRYTGAGKRTPIALTGKGIAFDSGGLSLKDPGGHGDDEVRHGRRGVDPRDDARRSPC